MNINGIDQTSDEHSIIQLYPLLKRRDVDDICLTEIHLDWKKHYLVNQFKRTIQEVWPKQKTYFCTSTSEIECTEDYKPGGTSIVFLKQLSSTIIQKDQDHSGLERWTYPTLLENKVKTIMFNTYCPCNSRVENVGSNTVIKNNGLFYNKREDKNILITQ